MNSTTIKLDVCPFCGKSDTLMFTNAADEEACVKAENGDCCCDFEPNGCAMVAVVCSVNKGGCGASSGYSTTLKNAAKRWNRRYNAGLVEAHEMLCRVHRTKDKKCETCPIYDGKTDCYTVFERKVAET